LVGNRVNDGYAAGLFLYEARTGAVENCIFWGNTGGAEMRVAGGPVTVRSCCVQGSYDVRGNVGSMITNAPLLDPSGYHLMGANSPCFDAGLDGQGSSDIDGDARPQNNRMDIGCDEFRDSDSDGMPDWWELASGLNPTQSADQNGDDDDDRLNNIEEYRAGTHAKAADTDGDNLIDGEDPFPTDPNNPPEGSILSPINRATFVVTANVPVVVMATSPVKRLSKVEFLADGVKYSEAVAYPYTSLWVAVSSGAHELAAGVIVS
jgi:hypothetical protein